MKRFFLVLILLFLTPAKVVVADAGDPRIVTRVSVATDGTQGNDHSLFPSISGDGRFVTFVSEASSFVSRDTNNTHDIFVHDRQTGQTTRVSVGSNGTQGDQASSYSIISGNGRFVAFESLSTFNLPRDINNTRDVFIHDRQTGETSRISNNPNGSSGNLDSYAPSISADGRFVAFASDASDLVSGDTNSGTDFFVHDRRTGQTTRVSVASDGTEAQGPGRSPYSASSYPLNSISTDGRLITFQSRARNLGSSVDGNGNEDIFVHDRQTGQTTRVSNNPNGNSGNNGAYSPSISADGRFVAFTSFSTDLVFRDINAGFNDVFVHELLRGETALVSVDSNENQFPSYSIRPSISADGRYIAFGYQSIGTPAGSTVLDEGIYYRDLQLGETIPLALTPGEAAIYGDNSSIDWDGRVIAFVTNGPLVPEDTNDRADIYVVEWVPAGWTPPVWTPLLGNIQVWAVDPANPNRTDLTTLDLGVIDPLQPQIGSVAIANIGNGSLHISAIQATSRLRTIALPAGGADFPPQGREAFPVQPAAMDPKFCTASASDEGVTVVSDDADQAAFFIPVRWTCPTVEPLPPPVLRIVPSSLSFDPNHRTKSVRIRNEGPGSVTLRSASISGANASFFQLTTPFTGSVRLRPNRSYNFQIRFTATARSGLPFSKSAVLNVETNIADDSSTPTDERIVQVPLTGTTIILPRRFP